MILAFFRLIFRLHGWKLHKPTPEDAFNCVMVAAPHTSNWDFVYALAALQMLGINVRFTIKKEMNRFPYGKMIESMGALWIDRKPKPEDRVKRSMIYVMADLFKDPSNLPMAMLVTAEGTRGPAKNWKTGFYHVAVKANLPICLAFMDYKTKVTGVGMCFKPSGNIKEDMKIIMDYYSDKVGKYPENFILDEEYK